MASVRACVRARMRVCLCCGGIGGWAAVMCLGSAAGWVQQALGSSCCLSAPPGRSPQCQRVRPLWRLLRLRGCCCAPTLQHTPGAVPPAPHPSCPVAQQWTRRGTLWMCPLSWSPPTAWSCCATRVRGGRGAGGRAGGQAGEAWHGGGEGGGKGVLCGGQGGARVAAAVGQGGIPSAPVPLPRPRPRPRRCAGAAAGTAGDAQSAAAAEHHARLAGRQPHLPGGGRS